jgi:hypothetical protein
MTLTKKGEFWYGTTSGDTQAELRSYSVANRYEAVRFAASKCDCGSRTFALQSDEEAGVAIRTCTDCGQEHLMGDSADYVEKAAAWNAIWSGSSQIGSVKRVMRRPSSPGCERPAPQRSGSQAPEAEECQEVVGGLGCINDGNRGRAAGPK